MDKDSITDRLEKAHKELFDWLLHQSDEDWGKHPDGRWTTGQHILHLQISLKMLNKALRVPKFILKKKFGTSNRPSRSYDEVAKRYNERLAESKDRARDFNKDLKNPSINQKKILINSIEVLNKKLQYKTRKLKDQNLNTLLLPHPLMGRMTLREIIMWTIHHTEHHLSILKKDYVF